MLERRCMTFALRLCLAACVFQPDGACWNILVLPVRFDVLCRVDRCRWNPRTTLVPHGVLLLYFNAPNTTV
jgi:hypothetical protein